MRIILTIAEAEKALNLETKAITSPEFESTVTIEAPELAKQSFPMWDAVLTVKRYRHKTDEKIAAIKALRAFASQNGTELGLLHAKMFVEAIA